MVWIRAALCLSLAFAVSGAFVRPYGSGTGFQSHFVPIVAQDFQLAPDGRAYTFSYSSADGSQRQESGTQRNSGSPNEAYAVSGTYSYTSPNGAPIQVNYVADEFGYQPEGAGVHPDISRAVAEQVAEARSNPQGYLGHQGYQGYQGSQGYQGYQGSQRYQGYQGNQGYQGYQGYSSSAYKRYR